MLDKISHFTIYLSEPQEITICFTYFYRKVMTHYSKHTCSLSDVITEWLGRKEIHILLETRRECCASIATFLLIFSISDFTLFLNIKLSLIFLFEQQILSFKVQDVLLFLLA